MEQNNNIIEKSFLEKIFSIKTTSSQKIYTLFGITIKTEDLQNQFKKFKDLPINNNKIVLTNFEGSCGYGCNPKYIAQEILKRKLPIELVWLIRKRAKKESLHDFPSNIRLVEYKSQKAQQELATAKIWIDNNRKKYFIKRGLEKKDGQTYIQTWHGALGIKKLDNDVKAFINEDHINWMNCVKKDSSFVDYFISNSTFETNTVPKALWFESKTMEFGHPRNDIFYFSDIEKKQIKEKVYKKLKIKKDKKICLYAPSFRDDKTLDCYNIDMSLLKQTLEKLTNESWVIVARLHPRIARKKVNFLNNCVNATHYPDIQELLVSSDVMITDYSSCIFDFMLSKKPGFIFATDIEKYNTERGFYYPLESTPFPIARNNEELMKNINNFKICTYKEKVEVFLKEKGCLEDGHASKRVVDLIEEVMKNAQ